MYCPNGAISQKTHLTISFHVSILFLCEPLKLVVGMAKIDLADFFSLSVILLAQYRQVKRGSLGALTMSQLMKRQLEHQSSAPHNISIWETGQLLLQHLKTESHYKLPVLLF